MHGNLPIAAAIASGVGIASDTDSDFAIASDSECRDWFYEAACDICGRKDAGYQLHLFTGWPLSSCRKFVAHDPAHRRRASPEFLRVLFRSKHGRPFWNAFMHGCDAEWYADLVRSEERAQQAEQKLRDIAGIVGRT